MSRYKIVPQNEITMVNGPWRIYHICFGVFSVKKRTCLQPGCEVSEFQQAPGCVAKNWQIKPITLSPWSGLWWWQPQRLSGTTHGHTYQWIGGDVGEVPDGVGVCFDGKLWESQEYQAFIDGINKNMCHWEGITVTGNSFTEVDFFLGSVSWCEVYSLVWYIAEWRRLSREEWCSWPFLEVNPSLFSGLFVESCFVHEQ